MHRPQVFASESIVLTFHSSGTASLPLNLSLGQPNDSPSSDLDPEMLQLLGTIVVKWSYVELFVSDLFVHLSKGEPFAMTIITSKVSQSSVSSWVITLLDFIDCPPDLTKDARDVFTEINNLRAERNTFVHGNWIAGIEPGCATVESVRLERSEVILIELMTSADFKAFLDRVQDVTIRLRSILVAFGAWKSDHD